MTKGYLVLEDGEVFEGRWHGDPTWVGIGEVIFNTSMQGYQEILTDPSYYQQIIVMTTPEMGNYGVADRERESLKIWAQGFVCVELTHNSMMPNGRRDLGTELIRFERPGLSQIDTRTLTLHLRSRGTPWGILISADTKEAAIEKAKVLIAKRRAEIDPDWVYATSTNGIEYFRGKQNKGRVAVYDFGTKENILGELKNRFAEIAVFNSRTKANDLLLWKPDGLVLTNGPGDPTEVKSAVGEVQKLLGQIPIFGICMGHQILALALGGKTFKLKFGHRGGNHPVRNLTTGEIYMTSQNHGYAVSPDLPTGVKVSHINLYDQTVEGIESSQLRAWSVQYHPESNPGPHDARVLFDYFRNQVTN